MVRLQGEVEVSILREKLNGPQKGNSEKVFLLGLAGLGSMEYA